MYALREIIETNPAASGMSKMAFVILPALADEVCAEMEDLDEMTIRIIMAQIGEVIAWIGHGDNGRLPESLREFAEGIQPTPETCYVSAMGIKIHGPGCKCPEDDEILDGEIVAEIIE